MDIMASQERLNKNWVWKYFLKLDNSFIKCNIYSCDQTYKIQYGKIKRTIAIAKRHLYHLHNIWNEEDRLKWENDNDLIWRYFDKIGLYKVKCKFCGSFYCQAYIPCLRQHLQNHSQEMKDTVRKEIVDKSLLQYFEIDEEFNAYCKRCNLKINLLYGKDVLRYHICFKKYVCNSKYQLEDNNVNRMRQQSIPEKTGTSSHHDINRQAPRNKNQQRFNVGTVGNNVYRMMQQSATAENLATSYHRESTSRQIFGNQEDQQSSEGNNKDGIVQFLAYNVSGVSSPNDSTDWQALGYQIDQQRSNRNEQGSITQHQLWKPYL